MNHYKQGPKPTISGQPSKSRGKSAKQSNSLLFYADATDPDMLYFSRFQAHDP
jgi:hypothetical protein